jgi:uncharacterized pyridoxamine 5'-phosphate oxidase family protein
MNKPEIIQFLNDNPTCYLATSDKNKPHVRAMRMVRADEKGLIFQTVDGKDLPKQMKGNPDIEVCFFNADKGIQIRVSGRANELKDIDLKKEIVEKRPFLKELIDKKGFDVMPVFRIVDCVAVVWTMKTNFLPKEYIKL